MKITALQFLLLLLPFFCFNKAFAAYAPEITISTPELNPCEGTDITVTAAVTGLSTDRTYQWTINGKPTGNNLPTLIINSSTETLSVRCMVTDNTTGASITSDALIINYLKYISANVSIYYLTNTNSTTDPTYCSGAVVTIGRSYTYDRKNLTDLFITERWQVNGIDVPVSANAGFLSTTLKEGDAVTCRVTFNGRCIVQEIAVSNALHPHITPNLMPTISIVADNAGQCIGPNSSYTATAINAGDKPEYEWSVNGVKVAGNNSPKLNGAALVTGDRITCTVTGINQCGKASATSNEILLNDAIPQISNSVSITSSAVNNIIVAGELVNFEATASYTTGISYQWQVNGINAGTDSPLYSSNTLTNGDVVTCNVTTPGVCVINPLVTSNAIKILIKSAIIIPNTFTPNSDGINDTWNITALLAYPGCTIDVYNRYGTQVYHTLNYVKGWDGTYGNKPLPAGPYYYVINPNDGSGRLSGNVTILR